MHFILPSPPFQMSYYAIGVLKLILIQYMIGDVLSLLNSGETGVGGGGGTGGLGPPVANRRHTDNLLIARCRSKCTNTNDKMMVLFPHTHSVYLSLNWLMSSDWCFSVKWWFLSLVLAYFVRFVWQFDGIFCLRCLMIMGKPNTSYIEFKAYFSTFIDSIL